MSDISGLNIVVACDEKGGIGREGSLPWNIPEDLRRFKELTDGGTVIMGRATYDEIIKKFPNRTDDLLPGRKAIVLSRNSNFIPVGSVGCDSLRKAIENAKDSGEKRIFIIGGEKLFVEALPFTNMIYLTLVNGIYQCDRKFPLNYAACQNRFVIEKATKFDGYSFIDYKRIAP